MLALVHQKKININFSKANIEICLSLHYNIDNSYLFVNEKISTNLKLVIKITFHLNFV